MRIRTGTCAHRVARAQVRVGAGPVREGEVCAFLRNQSGVGRGDILRGDRTDSARIMGMPYYTR